MRKALVLICGCLIQASSEAYSQRAAARVQKILDIPPTLASVTDQYFPEVIPLPEFILIQDVHLHPEVQRHIAALIGLAYSHWASRTIFVEGAFSVEDLSAFDALPPDLRESVAQNLIDEGNLTGAELAQVLLTGEALSANSAIELVGMEDRALYEENLCAYRAVLEGQPQAMGELRRQRPHFSREEAELAEDLLRVTGQLLQLKLSPTTYLAYEKLRRFAHYSPSLKPVIRAAERFYQLADRRSAHFVQTIEASKSRGPRIVIVGGFHTSAMAAQ